MSYIIEKRHLRLFKPTKQRFNKKPVFGFDIETYDDGREFYCGSIFADRIYKDWQSDHVFFYEKQELINELKKKKFENSLLFAINLQYDFNGLFYGTPEIKQWRPQYNGSRMIWNKSYLKNKKFHFRKESNHHEMLMCIDLANILCMRAEQIGELINVNKMQTPSFIGERPKTVSDKAYMKRYNILDSQIACQGALFAIDSFQRLGATFKPTVASNAMSIFTNQYHEGCWFGHPRHVLRDLFKAYYGGRTEVFSRGMFTTELYQSDIVSLYPSQMLKPMPDPNSIRYTTKGDPQYIYQYEGFSNVDLYCPYMKYPLLPYRADTKLIFPIGTFSGWYTHVELRAAVGLGYRIRKIYSTYWFKSTIKPFTRYVNDLFSFKKEYKQTKNPMIAPVKLALNGLYGKTGQKFWDRDNIIPFHQLTAEEIWKYDKPEPIGNTGFCRVREDETRPAVFCFPEIAAYITAYGRIEMHKHITQSQSLYCDTDSTFSMMRYPQTGELGEMAHEHILEEFVPVRPKMYGKKIQDQKFYSKIKGLPIRLDRKEFYHLLRHPTKDFTKILKFREALRRGLQPNELVMTYKTFSLEDDKRQWFSSFSYDEEQHSEPLIVVDGAVISCDAETYYSIVNSENMRNRLQVYKSL